MELGEKILKARQEAKLSQRQLCGDTITRNMLSQIEHGTAKPSMGTLKILAERLGKPVSYFLEEDGAVTANHRVMLQARTAWDEKNHIAVLEVLKGYRHPDEIFDREYWLLSALARLSLAEEALLQGKPRYARELLEKIGEIPYVQPELQRRIGLLEAKISGSCKSLPSLDEELLLRSHSAFQDGHWSRSLHLLEAMEDHTSPHWNLLRGRLYARQEEWRQAACCLHKAEDAFPAETARGLEQCYRELEDFRQAYFYACKQKR